MPVLRPLTGRLIGWLSALLPALAIGGHCHAQSVLGYHGSPDRSGNFIVPALNWERARSLHLDPSFHPQFAGHLYAQPLYWQPPGSATGMLNRILSLGGRYAPHSLTLPATAALMSRR